MSSSRSRIGPVVERPRVGREPAGANVAVESRPVNNDGLARFWDNDWASTAYRPMAALELSDYISSGYVLLVTEENAVGKYLLVLYHTEGRRDFPERVSRLVETDPAAEFVLLVPATRCGYAFALRDSQNWEAAQRRALTARASLSKVSERILDLRIRDGALVQAIRMRIPANPISRSGVFDHLSSEAA